MRIEATQDELDASRRLNDLIEQVLAGMPSVHTQPVEETRRLRREGGGIWPVPVLLPQARTESVPGSAGDVPVRIFVPDDTPDGIAGVYLHLHGGGWVLGAADQNDERLWQLATATGCAVVSVEYRLAPEHPFPAGPDDCEAVARWLLDGGAAALGSERLVIGGESAGAHLAMVTLLRLRDGGADVGRFVGADLVYGAYDLGGTPSQRSWGDRNLILSEPIMTWFYECALPGTDAEQRRDPAWSPLYADLSGMPPALLMVGDLDPLLDDSLFLAARLEAAGSRADCWVFPESIHGFNAFPTTLAERARDLEVGFLREVLGLAPADTPAAISAP